MSHYHIKTLFVALLSLLLFACAAGPKSEQFQPDPKISHPISQTDSIVFIHGMYMTPEAWDEWQAYFQKLGYKTYAPAWPYHEVSVKEQKERHPYDNLAELRLRDIVSYYQEFIAKLEEPPIVIGHSMGGLVSQLLLAEGVTAGAVVINSAPPRGVLTMKPSFMKANMPHLNPFLSSSKPAQLTFEDFQYAFANDMPDEQQKKLYEKHMVPESRKVGRGALSSTAKVNYKAMRPPLLVISGGDDHIIPASLNYSNFKKYKQSPSVTYYKEFEGRNHLTLVQDGWENVASYIKGWIEDNK